jgi:geranylgeranyl diphosphate synthase type I
MLEFLGKNRGAIEEYLDEFFTTKKQELSRINRWGRDLMERLAEFTTGGKMIRGSMLIFAYRMFVEAVPHWLVQTAAALELLHSSLLIHDDIMDRDTLRRGRKTVFIQYREIAQAERLTDPTHFGQCLGICAGDVGFHLAFEMISCSEAPQDVRMSILSLWSQELVSVGLAQMQDMYFSAGPRRVGESDILHMYQYKTARYTFSLPLMSGALAAGQNPSVVEQLSQLGENLGIIFQIKDDELGLFGVQQDTGKRVGSDIKEKKKTLFAFYLSEIKDPETRKKVLTILQKQDISSSEIHALRSIAEESGVMHRIAEKHQQLMTLAKDQIQKLPVSTQSKDMLRAILAYNLERRR